jgi:hypothetical protein
MCFACKTEMRCDHSVTDCPAVDGEYCMTCHHDSSLATPARRKSMSLVRKSGPERSALLREIRQRRGRPSLSGVCVYCKDVPACDHERDLCSASRGEYCRTCDHMSIVVVWPQPPSTGGRPWRIRSPGKPRPAPGSKRQPPARTDGRSGTTRRKTAGRRARRRNSR